jgi:hypothetical protein
MKLTFKQFNTLNNLSEDQFTEEKLEEIFGAFFGGKSKEDKAKTIADLKSKKDSLQANLQKKTAALTANKQNLNKNQKWMDWVAAEKAKKSGQPQAKQKAYDAVPTSQHSAGMAKAAERDWAMGK